MHHVGNPREREGGRNLDFWNKEEESQSFTNISIFSLINSFGLTVKDGGESQTKV